MAGIYCAEIYCNDCITVFKDAIAAKFFFRKLEWILPNGTNISDCHQYEDAKIALESMDERGYDDNEYPKHCDDNGECSNGPLCLRDSV